MCFFSTCNKLVLRQHTRRSHKVIKEISCAKCDLKFSSPSELYIHKKTKHTKMLRKCPSCEFSCYHQSRFERHSKKHETKQYKKCDVCLQEIRDLPALIARHAKKHACDICKKVVDVNHKHPKRKNCPLCDKIVPLSHQHKNTENQEINSCTFCQKTFAIKEYLKIHMRTHTKEKPYTCSLCNKSFSQLGGLARHKLACTDVREVSCLLCASKFRTDSDRVKHTSAVHFKVRKFKCNQCPKAFTDGTPLKYHQKTAHGDGSHLVQCPSCERKFSDKRHFKRHNSKVHENDKSARVNCPICGKQYTDKEGLKKHRDKYQCYGNE